MEFYDLIWILSGLVSGVTSFGGNLIAIPVLSLFMMPFDAIVISAIAFLGASVSLLAIYRKHILWKDIIPLMLGALAGIPPGIYFLGHVSSRVLLLGASASVFLFIFWRMFSAKLGQDFSTSNSFKLGLVSGLLSGLLTGATSMGGPPMALYAICMRWNKEQTIACLNLLVILYSCLTLPIFYYNGFFNGKVLLGGLWGAFLCFLGILLSLYLIKYINVRLFYKLVMGIVWLSAFSLLVKGLLA